MKVKRLLIIFILLLLLSLLPQIVLWSHKHVVLGLNPFANLILPGIVLLISIFVFILSYSWFRRNALTGKQSEPAILFFMGALCWLISWIVSGNATTDMHLHNINARPFSGEKISILFGIISLIYLLFASIFKLDFNIRLTRIHFWVTFIGLIMAVTVINLDMQMNRPSRYTDYGGWNIYSRIDYYKLTTLFPIVFVVIAQFVFIFNIIYAILTPRNKR
jgi:heme/copper-type cytochrome/quinol oxidase subunit 1